MSEYHWWNPPPATDLDLWWHALRIAAPDTDDFTARHRRGHVVLPWDLGEAGAPGQPVPAWVCCDPACGGVELGESVLEINHSCCTPLRCRCDACVGAWRPARRHMAGLGRAHFTGWHHGPYTAFWEPGVFADSEQPKTPRPSCQTRSERSG
jgi:hypothetical protein